MTRDPWPLVLTMLATLLFGLIVSNADYGRQAGAFGQIGKPTALSPYGSSQQAVSPVPASIAFAGDTQ